MIISTYIRPKTEPYKLYCRVCERFINDSGWVDFIGNKAATKAQNLEPCFCGECGTKGSLVFILKKDIPHCGNINCNGACSDELCLGIIQDRKSERFDKLAIRIRLQSFVAGFILGFLVFKLITEWI